MIGEQLEKFASAREKAVQDQASAGISSTAQATGAGKAPPAPFDVGKFAGIFAAIGLAIGAIGTAIASVVTGFISLSWWQMPLAILGLILIISGPSMLLAYLKLRKRNLAPLLDGNGWAVNTRAIINIPFGASLTKMATLPPGAQRSLVDPYAEKQAPWKLYLFLLALIISIALLWNHGFFQADTLSNLTQRFSSSDKPTEKDNKEQKAAAHTSETKNSEKSAETTMDKQPASAQTGSVVPAIKPVNATLPWVAIPKALIVSRQHFRNLFDSVFSNAVFRQTEYSINLWIYSSNHQ